jgi:integrase
MAKKRSAGEGTIAQLPSGSWRAQVSLKGRRLSYTSKNQQGARDWIRKIQAQIEQGLTYDDERTTLGIFMEGWLATKKNQLRAASTEQYYRMYRSYIEPKLGSIRLKDLSPGRIQNLYDDLSKTGRGGQTIRVAHVVLHMCLEQAKQLGLVARNPAELCKVPKSLKVEMTIWDEDQVNRFLVSIHGHKNENLYSLALATGMRRGELLGLKWQDVDWIHHKILIHRQVSNPEGGGFVFQEPKTNLGVRSVQLGMGMIERLRSQLGNIDLMRRISRDKWQEYDLIFPSILGKPQYGNNVSIEFQELVSQSGLPRIRFHDCRHTAASIMLSHGIPPVIVAGMLGHSITTLLSTYAHFIPDMQDEAAILMDGIISSTQVDLVAHGLHTKVMDRG